MEEMDEMEDYDTPEASEYEGAVEYSLNVGREDTGRAWILTANDMWLPNPFYEGEPVPHPESD